MYRCGFRLEPGFSRTALVNRRHTESASVPPDGITGLDGRWSRLVDVVDEAGAARTWHLLDSWATRQGATEGKFDADAPELTLLCVHGNPSWSFLWRHVLSEAPSSIRVIAMDQLDMGFSERTGVRRTLSMRIDDLHRLTQTLGITGPVVSVAHDWGGPISLGWALRQVDQAAWLAGVVLTNTAVHQPPNASAPAAIRLIRSAALLKPLTVHTNLFIRGAEVMSKPSLAADVCVGFNAPYRTAKRREAIADFVEDIPLEPDHESAATLDAIATGLATLSGVPALLLWGPRDKVFSDLYLHDLEARLPHAQVHRYPNAAHFVSEDADVSGAIYAWLDAYVSTNANVAQPILDTSSARRALADFSQVNPNTDAVVEIAPAPRAITFGELASRVEQLAIGMASFGIRPGERVAVMVTPGVELALTVYACWRLGVTLVLVDSGLGRSGMQRALKSANPKYLVGIDKALIAARVLGWPGLRIALGSRSRVFNRSLGVVTDLESLGRLGDQSETLAWPAADCVAAVIFTSGSTGPSKGVIYQHAQVQAQRDVLAQLYSITPDDRLVAAFAPFALYGPTLGVTSIVPDMDVTKPGTLSAAALADAVKLIQATLVFASPAALVNIVATRKALSESQLAACAKVRLGLSAGAPVRAALLNAARQVFVNASFHTPYGMTEVLPLASISLDELQVIEASTAGVCVGYPVPEASILIDPLDEEGVPEGMPVKQPGLLGEILVRASHIRQGYDRLWATEQRASVPEGMHRTGDIGELDEQGRLWVGGRLVHIITTPQGPLAPVASEQNIETIENVDMAAVVGVGPVGTQCVVAVVQMSSDAHAPGSASLELVSRVRGKAGALVDIAAVLVVRQLPVDRRHNSKVDRNAVAQWATRTLGGEKVAAP